MSKTSLFHSVNTQNAAITDRMHLRKPQTPFRMIVGEKASLMVFMTKKSTTSILTAGMSNCAEF